MAPIQLQFLIATVLISPFAAQNLRAEEKQILDTVLFGYDTRIRPSGSDEGPIQVKAQVYIRHINNFDPFRGELCIQATLREWWTDRRLAYHSLSKNVNQLNIRSHKLIWIPDTFVTNSLEQTPIDDNELIRISPDGTVLFSRRLNLKLKCYTNTRKYPFDSQLCKIKLSSYGSTSSDLEYYWTDESDPLLINDHSIHATSTYEIKSWSSYNGTNNVTTGEYSYIRLDLTLANRSWSRIVLILHLPLKVLVALAWLSFFLDPVRHTARLLYCLVLILTATILIHGYQVDLDRNYSKTIRSDDWWAGVCFTFIVFALVEFFALNWTGGSADGAVLTSQSEKSVDPEAQTNMEPLVVEESSNNVRKYKLVGLRTITAQRLDHLCRVFYPVLFILWALLYAMCVL